MDIPGIRSAVQKPIGAVADRLWATKVLAEAGVIRALRPDKLGRVFWGLQRWGPSPAAGATAGAIVYPDEIALYDEAGSLTFEEVHRRSNALAHGFRDAGIAEGDGVAILCRNHRYFIEATLACSKLGANGLYMNTAFSGPQLEDVTEREGPAALVYDEEFTGLLSGAEGAQKRFVAWRDEAEAKERGGEEAEDAPQPDGTLDELIESSEESDLTPPEETSRFVILTSGTTGKPKGAQRQQPDTLTPIAALVSKIPLRVRENVMIAAPMFHSWGFAHYSLGMLFGSTYVLRRRFDPEDTLKAIEEQRCAVLVVVPVMMQRILELPEETRRKYDTGSLRVTAASGSALPGELATKWMDEFGDNLYNLYGSTEVAWATIATPDDLRAAPGTAGRPPRGTKVRIVDENGEDVSKGETGRVFVGNEMVFEGYTGGGSKDVLDGLLSSGDVGHFDEGGRLFIDGRDDEMIVSGGENVFPREVEDLLASQDAVEEVAVIGVDDEQFGQRLKAFVVTKQGASISEDEIKAIVKSNLARYKVPREVDFLDELPRNATGKVLKRELA